MPIEKKVFSGYTRLRTGAVIELSAVDDVAKLTIGPVSLTAAGHNNYDENGNFSSYTPGEAETIYEGAEIPYAIFRLEISNDLGYAGPSATLTVDGAPVDVMLEESTTEETVYEITKTGSRAVVPYTGGTAGPVLCERWEIINEVSTVWDQGSPPMPHYFRTQKSKTKLSECTLSHTFPSRAGEIGSNCALQMSFTATGTCGETPVSVTFYQAKVPAIVFVTAGAANSSGTITTQPSYTVSQGVVAVSGWTPPLRLLSTGKLPIAYGLANKVYKKTITDLAFSKAVAEMQLVQATKARTGGGGGSGGGGSGGGGSGGGYWGGGGSGGGGSEPVNPEPGGPDPDEFSVTPTQIEVPAAAGTAQVSFVNGPPTVCYGDPPVHPTLGGQISYDENTGNFRVASAYWEKGAEFAACSLVQAAGENADDLNPVEPVDPVNPIAPVPVPPPIVPRLSVSPAFFSLPATSAKKYISVFSTEAWNVSSSADWATVSQDAGFGDSEIFVEFAENTDSAPRAAEIRFVSASGIVATVNVGQSSGGAVPVPPVIPASLAVSPGYCYGADYHAREWTLSVSSTGVFGVDVSALPDWAIFEALADDGAASAVASGEEYANGQKFRLRVYENADVSPREFEIFFANDEASVSVPVSQGGKVVPECENKLLFATAQLAAAGGSMSIRGTACAGWTWSVSSLPDWIVPEGEVSGVGADALFSARFAVAANTAAESRSATLSVAFTSSSGEIVTMEFTVSQDAAAQATISLDSPGTLAFPYTGATREISVTVSGGGAPYINLNSTLTLAPEITMSSNTVADSTVQYVFAVTLPPNPHYRRASGTITVGIPGSEEFVAIAFSQDLTPPPPLRIERDNLFHGSRRFRIF